VLQLLFAVVPLGLAASVSPVMLTEQTVLLASRGGRRTGLLYAAGAAAVIASLVGAILVVGRSLSLPSTPHLDASLDLCIGGLLIALAVVLHRWRPRLRGAGRRSHGPMTPPAALAFGVLSMVTNVTTLALVVPAAKDIAASHLQTWQHLTAAAFLVALACLPAWAPVALESAAPETAGRLLDRVERFIHRRGRQLVLLLIAGVGVVLLVRGAIRMIGT
jgi:threonine/homoserine/homoserine lactone efflux protein